MNTFNIRRFLQTVKWTELTLLSRTIRQTFILAIVFFLLTVFITHVAERFGNDSVVDGVESSGGLIMLIAVCYLIFRGAFLLNDVKRNQDRIFLLMLPASNAEKFWARVIHATLVNALICLVALVAADALQAIIHGILGMHTTSLTASAFNNVTVTVNVGIYDAWVFGAVLFTLNLIWLQSLYALGGTFFRKHQWICTTIVMMAGLAFFLAANVYVAFQVFEAEWLDGYVLDIYGTGYILMGIFVLFIALNYWLSYKLFTRLQLINNKWTNV